jgi:hypothetical protein
MTKEENTPSDSTSKEDASIWPIVVALAAVIQASIMFFLYDLPSGKEVGIIDYILFFNKDLLIFPVIIAFAVYWLVQKSKR